MMRRLLVAVAAVALLAGCDGSGDVSDAKPSPSATESASAGGSATPTDPGPVVECPRKVAVDPDPTLPDAVPDGATSVRLCGVGPREITPIDALTTNVTAISQAVNDQRITTRACADHLQPSYQLAFGYPDGTSFTVSGRFTSCAELLVGSVRRANALPPLDRFIDLLRDQRATTSPPAHPVDLDSIPCGRPPAMWTVGLAEPSELSRAVLCVGEFNHPGLARRAVVSSRELATLTKSMKRDTVDTSGQLGCPPWPPRVQYWFVGTSAWGDPIALQYQCVGLGVDGNLNWRPHNEAKAIIADLVAKAR